MGVWATPTPIRQPAQTWKKRLCPDHLMCRQISFLRSVDTTSSVLSPLQPTFSSLINCDSAALRGAWCTGVGIRSWLGGAPRSGDRTCTPLACSCLASPALSPGSLRNDLTIHSFIHRHVQSAHALAHSAHTIDRSRIVPASRSDGDLIPAPDRAAPRDAVHQQRCERGLHHQR